jgi:hypothetical protein
MRILSIALSVALASFAGFAGPAGAKEEKKALAIAALHYSDNLGTAMGLQAACPTWRVNQDREAIDRLVLSEAGLPDEAFLVSKDLHNHFMVANVYSRGLSEAEACANAEKLFGPDGTWAPGWMKKR